MDSIGACQRKSRQLHCRDIVVLHNSPVEFQRACFHRLFIARSSTSEDVRAWTEQMHRLGSNEAQLSD